MFYYCLPIYIEWSIYNFRAGKKDKLDPGYETVPYNNRSQLSDPSTSSSSQGLYLQDYKVVL